ncbi:MAG: hypothetical protein KDA80_18665 [Planctomycetaceae bacterium]|nr:hypothetical protein [Planctomycetaceae bacterium]
MEFSFDVDPETDIAVGNELSFEDGIDGAYPEEDFDFTSVDPITPTEAKPGSEDKVRMLAARYAAGVPLWHDGDCYDHGPSDGGLSLVDGADGDSRFDLDEDF